MLDDDDEFEMQDLIATAEAEARSDENVMKLLAKLFLTQVGLAYNEFQKTEIVVATDIFIGLDMNVLGEISFRDLQRFFHYECRVAVTEEEFEIIRSYRVCYCFPHSFAPRTLLCC